MTSKKPHKDRVALNYRLTESADIDLFQLYLEGLADFGAHQADLYFKRLEQTFETLAANPKIAREHIEIMPPVRVHPCGSHMIVYEIDVLGVLILRVRHHRENWMENPL